MTSVGFFTALLAGMASFLSPCVLPLVPAYLSYISGISIEEMTSTKRVSTGKILFRALLFVIGFSMVFVAMGATATALGRFVQDKIFILNKIAGILIIIFGLHLTGLFRLRFLNVEKRYQGVIRGGPLGALLLGSAFGFGWTPCVGPILFSILIYAGIQEQLVQGISLLIVYSAGLGIPFLLTGLGTGAFIRLLDRFKKYLRWVEVASGLFLVLFGVLVMTGFFRKLSNLIPPEWTIFS